MNQRRIFACFAEYSAPPIGSLARGTRRGGVFFAVSLSLFLSGHASAQLFENLDAFGRRLDVGDPAVASTWRNHEGPKGVATSDFNGDGRPDIAASNLDGTVTVLVNRGGGRFSDASHLAAGGSTLRGIVAADFNGDAFPDLAAAAPLDEKVVLFLNGGGGGFRKPQFHPTWPFARDLATGDFDGDGVVDLAVGGSTRGLSHHKGQGDGSFVPIAFVEELAASGGSRPVYSLRAFRSPGEERDRLFATHAWSREAWILSAAQEGPLRITDRLPIPDGTFAVDIAPITRPAASGRLDLALASRDRGLVQIFASGDGPGMFSADPQQLIAVPGGPRALQVVDLDSDGWNDLVVAVRCMDLVLTYRNDQGTLVPSTEMPVGRSPRALAPADYNDDGHLDFAVINRISSDVSIVSGFPGKAGLGGLDQVYQVDGEVAALLVADLNGDSRDDVIQVHRASSDFSVRYADPEGRLGPPKYYPMGTVPNSHRLVDVNGDGRPDMVTANMGRQTVIPGAIAVRLGDENGEFGPERLYEPPADVGGQFFGLEVADFDGDGDQDVVVGYFDCRIGFFRGRGDGTFEFTNVHMFIYEPRALVSGDFDQDGDIDVAGASYTGATVVVENKGDLLSAPELTKSEYPAPTREKFGTEDLRVLDFNRDGDLDLLVASGDGVMVLLGREGMSFGLSTDKLRGTNFPASSIASADFDGNGKLDLAVACQVFSCIVILTQNDDGDYVPAVSVDVPAGRLLASGDLDGDGHADLVGSGVALWTALSSRRARPSAPPPFAEGRTKQPGPVINEILAINNRYPLPGNGGRRPDWVEIYNGSDEEVDLTGWKFMRTKVVDFEGNAPRLYAFPEGTTLKGGEYLLLTLTRTLRSPLHTGFRLPGRGGLLCLFDPEGNERDRLVYGPQEPNISYARYSDGARSFTFNNFPTPGAANQYNGPVRPILNLDRIQSASSGEGPIRVPRPGEPIRFHATGFDDEGIASASVVYQRLEIADSEFHRVVLYDDGLHDDGAMQDGEFSGVLEAGLPAGASMRYRVEVRDLSDNVTVFPDSQAPSLLTGSDGFYTLAMEESRSPLEISEIVSRNDTGLKDEEGGTPDWVEIRNCGDTPQSLDGIVLGNSFPASDRWYRFPKNTVLQPGAHFVVFCDRDRAEGPRHTGFNLPATGNQLILAETNGAGAHVLIDIVEHEKMRPDVSYSRLGCGGDWYLTAPTPRESNRLVPGDANVDGRLNVSDPIRVLSFLFAGAQLPCVKLADANADSEIQISDGIYLLGYLFGGGPAPLESPLGCEG